METWGINIGFVFGFILFLFWICVYKTRVNWNTAAYSAWHKQIFTFNWMICPEYIQWVLATGFLRFWYNFHLDDFIYGAHSDETWRYNIFDINIQINFTVLGAAWEWFCFRSVTKEWNRHLQVSPGIRSSKFSCYLH